MTTNSNGSGSGYIGRTRGLRQGGKRMASTSASASKPPLGSGARFKNLVGQLSKRPGTTNPAKLAAFIGQKKYGASKMSKMASHGRGGGKSS